MAFSCCVVTDSEALALQHDITNTDILGLFSFDSDWLPEYRFAIQAYAST